ncbi:MAG: FAD/NAD(P)-binding protein [Patescibacteria group bacterium]|jgi:NAD(P)H-flavin reductase|nr:FAD/NAD(P)-binding protein [Patescibacteria group bacterium]
MINPYLPKFVKIKAIRTETSDTKLFTFEFVDAKDRRNFSFEHGQFMMAGMLGEGEAAFDICSSRADLQKFDLAIRQVGRLTAKLHQLKVGDQITIRGPFGNGLPLNNFKNRDLLLIGGGCGFITMRSFALDYLAGKLDIGKLNIFYGCANEERLLFKKEYKSWRKKVGLEIALDKPSKNWQGKMGTITSLFNSSQDFTGAVALMVGPPAMYKFVIEELQDRGIKDEDIYLSLERRMYCGIGVCQHCAIGPYYVCKDGPVFSWAQLRGIPNAI